MRRYRSRYCSPPRGYSDRGRSSTTRRHDGSHEQNNWTLLVQNVHRRLRPKDLEVPFETFGKVQHLSLPKKFYRGKRTAFVHFVDPHDASKAQLYMDGITFGGRKITVKFTSGRRIRLKKFERASHRLSSPDGSCGSFFHGQEDLPMTSHSTDRTHKQSRSCSAMQRLGDNGYTRSLKVYPKRHHEDLLLSQVGGNDNQYVAYDRICSFTWNQVERTQSSLKSEILVVGIQPEIQGQHSQNSNIVKQNSK